MIRLLSLPILALAAACVALVFIAVAGVRRGMLTVRSRALLFVTAGVVLLSAAPLAIRSFWTPEGKTNEKPKFDVAAEFSIRQPNAEVVQVPFTAGSGSVNIGCEESRTITVQYALPQNAEQPVASAQWVNTDNLERQYSTVNMAGNTVTAIGTINGLHRNFLFNCPGGGHGELLLRGQYSVKHELPTTPILIKSLHDVAESGQLFTAAIPQVANSQQVFFKVTISDSKSASALEGFVTSTEKGGAYELKITSRSGTLPHDIRVDGQTLVATL